MAHTDPSAPSLQDLLRPLESRGALAPAAVLTRVLVHEIGNGLNPIGLQIELLRRRCAEDARALQVLDALRDTVRDLDRLLGSVRGFAHEVVPPAQGDPELEQLTAALVDLLHGRVTPA